MPRGEHMQVRRAKDDQWYFVHVHANNEDGPKSETYTRRSTAIDEAQNEHPHLPIWAEEELVRSVSDAGDSGVIGPVAQDGFFADDGEPDRVGEGG